MRSRFSQRVCKNALEKCIFSEFFTVHQTEKILEFKQKIYLQ